MMQQSILILNRKDFHDNFKTIWIFSFTVMANKNGRDSILAITTSNLHQIEKGRSVLKSAGSEDFKTDLTFDIWPSRS